MRTNCLVVGSLALAIGFATATPAHAEGARVQGTFSFAVDSASAPRPTLSVAFGRAPQPVGFELEYASTTGWTSSDRPNVGTIALSVLVKTPWRIVAAPVYVLGGIGLYGETGHGSNSGEAAAIHVGGGAAVPVAGPLKMRVEYRILALTEVEGPVVSRHPQRLSLGFSLGF